MKIEEKNELKTAEESVEDIENKDYSTAKNKKLMEVLENREVYWIDAVGADDPTFNDKFADFARNYPNIHIIEWEKEAKEHPEYLEPDKIHPNYKGGKALVKFYAYYIKLKGDSYLEVSF